MNRYQKNEEFQIPKICNDNAQIKIKFKKKSVRILLKCKSRI